MADASNLPVVVAPPKPGGAGAGSGGTVFLGPGLAYEAVSQASAMVVQDAASLMRQLGAVSTAALAVITEKIVQTEADPKWVNTFKQVTENLTTASAAFVQVGNAAANVLGYFQPGATVPPPPTGGATKATGGQG